MSKRQRGTHGLGEKRLRGAAEVLERRRNYLRGKVALAGDNANGRERAECAALDEVLVALYDVRAVPRRPGVEPKFREYRYRQVGDRA
ncbi:hypothetical protein P9990_17695 [Prescottella equi]|uniref:hypothetical protein n=1 Tax=Rhodococcus hoagii TaxID=43767 RepID=UPI0025756D08|nr:hypothetical protein [Prescottella equi]WJJ10406.1 hypothetical protein P9990_17695 [Prescottella equi]